VRYAECYCDYDPPDFYHREVRSARKEHACGECGASILPGEKYEYVSAKWDGYVDSFKTCEQCVDLRTWVKNNVPCLCIMHGNQDEENEAAINEAIFRAPEETKGLRFGFLRRKLLRKRRPTQAMTQPSPETVERE